MKAKARPIAVGDRIVLWVRGYRRHVTATNTSSTHISGEYQSHETGQPCRVRVLRDMAAEAPRLFP